MEQLKRDIFAAVVGFFFGCGVVSFFENIASLVMRL